MRRNSDGEPILGGRHLDTASRSQDNVLIPVAWRSRVQLMSVPCCACCDVYRRSWKRGKIGYCRRDEGRCWGRLCALIAFIFSKSSRLDSVPLGARWRAGHKEFGLFECLASRLVCRTKADGLNSSKWQRSSARPAPPGQHFASRSHLAQQSNNVSNNTRCSPSGRCRETVRAIG